MPFDSIPDEDKGHETFQVRIFFPFTMGAGKWHVILKLGYDWYQNLIAPDYCCLA